MLSPLNLLLILPLTLALSPSNPSTPLQTAHIFSRPVLPNPPAFAPLATLKYRPHDPSSALLTAFTPPKNTTDLTSIAVFSPSTNPSPGSKDPWRSSVTATRGFHAPFTGRFTILVGVEGDEVLGVSWRSYALKKEGEGGRGKKDGRGDFDVVVQAKAPVPYLESRGAGKGMAQGNVGKEGEEEEKDERSFLQKYWYIFLGVMVITLIAPGDK